MMATLHAYVLRELLKTFALTLVALTAVFTMGGGLYNVLQHEGVGAADLFGFLPMLIPIMAVLAMPVAALFATTMVYGRLAADNEIVACRAAGVNVHRLLLGAVLLGLFVAAFTLLFGDLVVPDFTHRLDRFFRTNLRNFAVHRLQSQGYIALGKGQRFLLTAERAEIPSERALHEKNLPTDPGITYLSMKAPVLLMLDSKDTLLRYASARQGLCQFDGRRLPPEITLYVDRGRDFDLRTMGAQLDQQQIGPIIVPLEFPRKASMVDLRTLRRWQQRPWEVDRLRTEVQKFMAALATERLLADATARLAAGQPILLTDARGAQFALTGTAEPPERQGLTIGGARLTSQDGDPARPHYFDAPRARLSRQRSETGQVLFRLELLRAEGRPVREHHPRTSDYKSGRERASFTWPEPFEVPPHVQAELAAYDAPAIFDPATVLPLSPELERDRAGLLKSGAENRRKMAAVLHFRLGVVASVVVIIVLAAALGVIFRGAQALLAFLLACAPFLLVVILMVMGRQLGEKPGTELLSPLLTWGLLGTVGLVDVAVVRLGVRR
jgi:lipopolysaccharide export LptBFGC system permease protein LptF